MKTSDATTIWPQGGKQLEYEIHPAAMIFPPLSGAEFESLKADIARNGLQLAIQVWEGKILDGRIARLRVHSWASRLATKP